MNPRNPKRKLSNIEVKPVRKQPLILETPPRIDSIKDLIEIGKSMKLYRNIDNVMLWKIIPHLEQLEKMIGMNSVKETVFYQVVYYLQGMHSNGGNEEYLHTMIFGEPGSGKTTVARIIGKLYQALGILSPNGKFTMAYRDDFIAGYLGQSAIKTRKLLESSIGGVLFVDEVYSLCPREKDKDMFSDEIIETITAFLSEHKKDFCFIGAGYEDSIVNRFFPKNKGLERRFQWIHKIEKYTVSELVDIMLKMISEMKWKTSLEKNEIVSILKNHVDLFKNAGGDIEIFLSKCKMMHAKRVFILDKEHRFILTRADFEEAFKIFSKSKIEKEKDEPPLSMYT